MMHIRLTSSLNKKKVLSNFQFSFGNKNSTNHALVSLNEMIRLTLDNDLWRRIYRLQKAYDIADRKIPLSKINHYRIRGIPYKLFKSYLINWQQFTIVNKKTLCTLKY